MPVLHGHALPLEDLLELEVLTVRSCDVGASWGLNTEVFCWTEHLCSELMSVSPAPWLALK